MRTLLRAPFILAAGAITLATGTTPAQALATTVTVGSIAYDVTYFEGSYGENSGSFNTGSMPWWGNQDLAKAFTDAVGNKLGTSNPAALSPAGPFFAVYNIACDPNNPFCSGASIESFYFNPGTGAAEYVGRDEFTPAYYATASLATTAVPGPAPLFGAAAAFRMSRRLRRRIKTSL